MLGCCHGDFALFADDSAAGVSVVRAKGTYHYSLLHKMDCTSGISGTFDYKETSKTSLTRGQLTHDLARLATDTKLDWTISASGTILKMVDISGDTHGSLSASVYKECMMDLNTHENHVREVSSTLLSPWSRPVATVWLRRQHC
jgi:hypothetical protein